MRQKAMEASSSTSTKERNAKKSDLIQAVNQLQNTILASGHKLKISLPQIVVIGCQSAGKSSVLERLVQKEFLPRGATLVTRCPIVIQLINSEEEYGVFSHRENEKFTNFSAIRDEIQRLTDDYCKPQEFSTKAISLAIYSPKVLDLTVVDLPGIIKVETGTQSKKAVEMSQEIVREYIKDPTTIILAITPANQQLSNSDAVEFARKVDPDGKRTIGVLTKIDKSELGTDGRLILENKLRPLERGWVGVKNDDSGKSKDMERILKEENDFFKNNSLYTDIADRMGVSYLQKLLHKTLKAHIKETLPKLRKDISEKLIKLEKELKKYDAIFEGGDNSKQQYMTDLIQKFCEDITVKIMGYSEKVPTHTLTPGALMNCKLHKEAKKFISQVHLPDENEIIHIILNIGGLRDSISVPSLSFYSSCKKLITRFEEPLYASAECIKQALLDAIEESGEILSPFPALKSELLYQMQSWVAEESEKTKDRFKHHIEAEMFYININHPDFDSSTCDPIAPPTGPAKLWSTQEDIREESADKNKDIKYLTELLKVNPVMQQQVKYVTALVVKYMEIFQKQISDIAVKYIAYFIVQKVLHSINHDLIKITFDSTKISSLTENNVEDIDKREEIRMSCKTLREALDAIWSF